ncbi:PH domain-containing protein [Tsukamurella soli]|uniref:PH domain-containing protein n=1 Tax=Tsukamurella soli TaxID=644556 RepID=UPI0036103F0A
MTRPDAAGWNRLSPWAIGTRVVKSLPSLVPALIGLVFLGRSSGPVVWAIVALLLAAAVGLVPWLTTTYRVTPTQLEVRRGLLRRENSTVRRDRVRSVDSEAGPLERVLGLRILKIGTGVGGEHHAIRLDPSAPTSPTPWRANCSAVRRTTVPGRHRRRRFHLGLRITAPRPRSRSPG